MATSDAPLSIGAVTLLTKNQSKLVSFYQEVIGLNVISSHGEIVTLGRDDTPLLYLLEDRLAKRFPKLASNA